MAYYRSVGNVPHKRHVQHRDPEGKLYYEELMGEEGFSSDSTLMYHRYIPAAIRETRPWQLPDQTLVPNDPMLPRHYKTQDLPAGGAGIDAVNGRRLLLGNGDVRISYVVAKETSPYYRNGIGDELLYVHGGTATVETVFGNLDVWEGDYVIIPRAT
ncbi:MAG TPA: homogentisate 1,2-dioxygenase, partial [Dermatophilaceae bacterium]|nr:homogentisate 1,2-dioxygenase [Dermatophilaceae bacterium]